MTQAFNRDCMEAMKEFPDNYFDLAVVDPPYGSGEAPEKGLVDRHNLRGRFGKYDGDSSQSVQVERERERRGYDGLLRTLECSPRGRIGYLNPNWIEWLMGYPIGWSELNASETQ